MWWRNRKGLGHLPIASPGVSRVRTIGVTDLVSIIECFESGLGSHRDFINRLNVYPVPDGDTGTNMVLTVGSVLAEIQQADTTMAAVCDAIAHGSLMGARGNSGVILSQILRGLSASFRDVGEIGPELLAEALSSASVAADQAVMKPVEGTILTVAREIARGARSVKGDLVEVLDAALAAGETALAKTPEQLAVLAEAGVVDAGGCGLLLFINAALAVADGRPMPEPPTADGLAAAPISSIDRPGPHETLSGTRYEVMFLLTAPDETLRDFKEVWAGLGDSIVVVGGEGLWNCHIHTNDIGSAIEAAIEIGRPSKIRVTDLAEEVAEERWVREAAFVSPPAPERTVVSCAVVAISPSAGIGRIFRSLGVQELVGGGQTMNPSTAEVLAAVEAAPGAEVIILPNNSNIIAVANRVEAETDKLVRVVSTRSVPEGFACLLAYDPEASAEDNSAAMTAAASEVVVGEVTRAVRATQSPAGDVAEGDWIGLGREGILAVADSAPEVAVQLLDGLVNSSHEIVTIIEGDGAGHGDTRVITEWLTRSRPGVEVEIHHGGQDHYLYLFGIE